MNNETEQVEQVDGVSVTVKVKVSFESIWGAICGAFEGGSNYWLRTAVLKSSEHKPVDKKLVWYGDKKLWTGRYTFLVGYDDPKLDEGNGKGRKLIMESGVAKGLALMAEKSPKLFAELLAGDDDAGTHDVMMQYIILGEIIYG